MDHSHWSRSSRYFLLIGGTLLCCGTKVYATWSKCHDQIGNAWGQKWFKLRKNLLLRISDKCLHGIRISDLIMDHCTAQLCLKLSTWVTGDFKEYNLELRNKNSSQSRLDVGQPIWENTMLELEDKSNPVKRSSGWVSGFSPRKLLIKVMEGNLHTNNFYSEQMFFHQNMKSNGKSKP